MLSNYCKNEYLKHLFYAKYLIRRKFGLSFVDQFPIKCCKTFSVSTGYKNHNTFLPLSYGLQSTDVWRKTFSSISRKYVNNSTSNDRLLNVSTLTENLKFINIFLVTRFKKYERLFSDRNKSEREEKSSSDGKGSEDEDPNRTRNLLVNLIVFTAVVLFLLNAGQQVELPVVSWNEFYHQMLSKGEVERIIVFPGTNVAIIRLHEGAIIKGRPSRQIVYRMSVVDVDHFEQRLRDAEQSLGIKPENGVPVIYNRATNQFVQLLVFGLFIAFMLWVLYKGTSISASISSKDLFGRFNQMSRAKFTIVDPLTGAGKGVRFSDVAGLKEAKVEIMEFVDYLKNQQKYMASAKLGAKVPRGVLLLGPPGCGKTMLAKAVATEASVPFLAMAGSEFIEMIGGLGAARVRDLFQEAKKRAPCIIYIDEIDAIGKKRSSVQGNVSGEEDQTLNQLLVEMDGMSQREGVIMLASTNRADVLDKALLRPGRFDRHILIDFPTLQERVEIFEQHMKCLKLDKSPSNYSQRLAQLTPGFSGADIANVCNESALHAAKNQKPMISEEDLEVAIERVIGGTEKRSHVMRPEERKMVAYHECGHALVGWLLKHTDALLKVSIVPRTSNVLGFAQYLPTDQKLQSKEELFDKMCMALGGRVAESLTFNKISTGAKDDLEKVTKMAYAQIKHYGMDPVVGNIAFPTDEEMQSIIVGKKPYSKKLANTIDIQARLLVAAAYKKTEAVLMEHKAKLKLLAEELLKREVLNYSDIENLIGPPCGKKKIIEALDLGPPSSGEGAQRESNDNGTKDG